MSRKENTKTKRQKRKIGQKKTNRFNNGGKTIKQTNKYRKKQRVKVIKKEKER
jgi:hypothetical protein